MNSSPGVQSSRTKINEDHERKLEGGSWERKAGILRLMIKNRGNSKTVHPSKEWYGEDKKTGGETRAEERKTPGTDARKLFINFWKLMRK